MENYLLGNQLFESTANQFKIFKCKCPQAMETAGSELPTPPAPNIVKEATLSGGPCQL